MASGTQKLTEKEQRVVVEQGRCDKCDHLHVLHRGCLSCGWVDCVYDEDCQCDGIDHTDCN